MAVRFYADYITTETNDEVLVEIDDSTFGGTSTKVKGTGSDWFSDNLQNLDDREPLSNPIQQREVTTSLWITDSSIIDDIFSAEEGQFTLIYTKNSSKEWEGTIIPDLCSYRQIETNLWKLKLTAKDFTALKGEYYTSDGAVDGSLLDGRETIKDLLIDLLPYSLGLKTHTSWVVQGETSTDDFLRQIYVDKYALRTFARTGDESDEPITKYEALEWICKAYGFIIKQEGGVWVVDQITAHETPTSVLESVYNSAGTLQSEGNVDNTTSVTLTIDKDYNHNPGIKSARLKYEHRTSISGATFPSKVELSDSNTSETFTYLNQSIGNQSFTISASPIRGYFDTNPASTARIRIKIQAGDYYWNNISFEWEPASGGEVINRFAISTVENQTGDEWLFNTGIKVITNPTPADADGDLIFTIYNADYTTGAGDEAVETFWENLKVTATNPNDEENSTYIDFKLTQSGSQSFRTDYNEVYFGNGPTAYTKGAITTDSAGTAFTDTDWARRDDGGTPTYIPHAHVLLREILDVQRTSTQRISATVKSSLNFGEIVSYDSNYYFILGGTFDGFTGVSTLELLRINIQTASDTFEELPKFASDETVGTSNASLSSGGGGLDQSTADARYLQQSNNLSDLDSASTARTNLGLVIGTDVQAQSSTLQDLSDSLTATAIELNRLDGTPATVRSNLGLSIGSDVQAWDADLDTYAGNPLTSVELDQLQNINSVTISNTQWGYLGSLNQGLTTTSNVTFNNITANGTLDVSSSATVNSLDIGTTGHGFDSAGNVSGLSADFVNSGNSSFSITPSDTGIDLVYKRLQTGTKDLELYYEDSGGSQTRVALFPANTSSNIFFDRALSVEGQTDYESLNLLRSENSNETQRIGLTSRRYASTSDLLNVISVFSNNSSDNIDIGGVSTSGAGATAIRFRTGLYGVTPSLRGTIDSSGKLDWLGNVNINSNILLNSDGTSSFSGDLTAEADLFVEGTAVVGISTTFSDSVLKMRADDDTVVTSSSIPAGNHSAGILIDNLSTTANIGSPITWRGRGAGTAFASIAATFPSANNSILRFYVERSNTFSEKLRIDDKIVSQVGLTINGDSTFNDNVDILGTADIATAQIDTLRTTLFKPNSVSGMGGEFIFQATSLVTAIDTGTNTITVEEPVFGNGDALVVSSQVGVSGFSKVRINLTSSGTGTGPTTYSYTVDATSSGVEGDIEVGDTAVKVNDNLIYINANDVTNSPFIEGYNGVSGFDLLEGTATPNWYIRNNEISVGSVFSANGSADTGRLASGYFDANAFWGGNATKANATLRLDFANQRIRIGDDNTQESNLTGAGIYGTNWYIDSQNWLHPSLSNLIWSYSESADPDSDLSGSNSADSLSGKVFSVITAASGAGDSSSLEFNIMAGNFRKQFGHDYMVVWSRQFADTAGTFTSADQELRLKINGSTVATETMSPLGSGDPITLVYDMSGLSNDATYNVELSLYTAISTSSGESGSSTAAVDANTTITSETVDPT